MTIRTVRLPDVGEGIAEAELVAWYVAVGDAVTSDTVIAEVLTDKATVEIYAPVAGTITVTHGAPGDVLAVGSDFVGIETGDAAGEPAAPETPTESAPTESAPNEPAPTERAPTEPAPTESVSSEPAPSEPAPSEPASAESAAALSPPQEERELIEPPSRLAAASRDRAEGVRAAPAVRERARVLGIDLADVETADVTRPVSHADLDRHLARAATSRLAAAGRGEPSTSTEIPLIGLRRKIASRMTASLRIPHITYVEEVDVTQLEQLRRSLTTEYPEQPRLTLLPFAMRAVVLAVAQQPHLNATLDDQSEPEVLTTHAAVHVGIATQTSTGLIVPVVRDAQLLDIWRMGAELARVSAAARDGSASRGDLSGSTITITSLGALGGLATTPIINTPEVAIVGINKMQTRPMWDGAAFVPRQMINLSSSFDHRVVDGFDAATFVQRIKTLLEQPTLLFVPPP